MSLRQTLANLFWKLGLGTLRENLRGQTAVRHLKKNITAIRGEGPIRIAFIVYEPAMWDKQEPVYLEALSRSDMEPYLIVVPDITGAQELAQQKQEFFMKKYDHVLLYDENTVCLFEKKHFHYTFYQTPYSFKYPAPLQPYKLVKHTKICFVPYGYIGSGDFFEISSNRAFFDNVYFGFMDSEPMAELLHGKYEKNCASGLQHFDFWGYPPFEYYLNLKKEKGDIQNVLWIPRWSYAETGGGSHFLEHKDLFNDLAKNNPQINWTMRPHPLMFPTLARQGLFSEEDAAAYRKALAEANVYLDENSLLNDTLCNTDLMIADFSSIIIMYFLTGRPIIYCEGGLELSGVYLQLQEGMYIAHSWEDVLRYTEDLKNGIDPLKEKRLEIIAAEGKKHYGASKRIVDTIQQDYRC